jgi:hypothetical protein
MADILSAESGLEVHRSCSKGELCWVGRFSHWHPSLQCGTRGRWRSKTESHHRGIAWVGRIFIAITLGVLFAGVYMSALTAMIERLSFILNFIRQLVGF